MAKITRGENGLLVDGEPFDPKNVRELSDEELDQTVGGIKIYTEFEDNVRGGTFTYAICPYCGGDDWRILGVYDKNVLDISCINCGRSSSARIDTH